MKILVLQHVLHEHPGYILQYAKEKNIDLDIVELWKKYHIPNLADYQALIVMGGPMGVYEEFPSKNDEIETIKKALGKIPILGFCLGSQLLAHALGAEVFPNIRDGTKIKEVGYFQIDLTQEGQASGILRGFDSSFKVLEWHGDVFNLPSGADLLASSKLCVNQAFSYKNAFGFLFHFEFTPEMVEKQVKIDKKWMHEENLVDEKVLIKEAYASKEAIKKQCYQLLDNFLFFIPPDRV